jgi:hypothetical protein
MSAARFLIIAVGVLILACPRGVGSAEPRADAELAPPDRPGGHGVVIDPDGLPVVGAMVIPVARGRNLFREYNDNRIPKTDADGRFELPGGAPTVLAVFSLDWQLQSVRVQHPLKEPLKIVMRKGKRVEVRTVDPQGRPIAGIHFYPERPNPEFFQDARDKPYYEVLDFLGHRHLIRNRSDENGLFVWENAPGEALRYQIVGSDVLSQPGGRYGPEGSPYTLVFRQTISVNATVVDAATGDPIAKYEIIQGMHFKSNRPGVWSWHPHKPGRKGEVKAGGFSDRLLTLDRLYRYRIQAEGYRPALSTILDAASLPDDPVALEFRLQKQSDYEGTLLTPDGVPAGGAEVHVKAGLMELSLMRVVDGNVDVESVTSSMTAAPDGKFGLAPSKQPFICFISHESGYAELMDVDLLAHAEHRLVPWATSRAPQARSES